jgi:hypothetical protein
MFGSRSKCHELVPKLFDASIADKQVLHTDFGLFLFAKPEGKQKFYQGN